MFSLFILSAIYSASFSNMCLQAEVQAVYADQGSINLHTRSLKYGKVSFHIYTPIALYPVDLDTI